jgi:tRNA nucleotidyltransferase (CCA-adding enzyme)
MFSPKPSTQIFSKAKKKLKKLKTTSEKKRQQLIGKLRKPRVKQPKS